MTITLIAVLLVGICAGIITGLIPGIHINLISVFLVSVSPVLLQWLSGTELAVFIIAMSITHTFVDAIPSIYLGAPDESMALSALPGHKMLLEGLGHNALMLTVIGSFFTIVLSFLLVPLFAYLMGVIYPVMRSYTGFVLIGIMLYLFLSNRKPAKIAAALFIFLLAGAYGILILNMEALHQPLFHLLSGLFGTSLLLLSLLENAKIPPQQEKRLHVPKRIISTSVLGASFAGFVSAFLPGFGSSQAAILATQFLRRIGDKGFLILTGGLNSASMLISLCSFYILEKARNGSVLAVQELIGTIDFPTFIVFLLCALIVAGFASIVALWISRVFSKFIVKVNYRMLVIAVIGLIVIFSFAFDGVMGLFILICASSLGILATELKVAKSNLMGSLILPVILYFVL